MSEGNGHRCSKPIHFTFLAVYLLGVAEPLLYVCRDPERVVNELYQHDGIAWVSWNAPTGHTVLIRPSHVQAVHDLWETDDERVLAELEAATGLVEGEWPEELEQEVLVYLAGRPEALRFTHNLDEKVWPVPKALLCEGGHPWLYWRDQDGEDVHLQSSHIMAMVYPTEFDQAALAFDEGEHRRTGWQDPPPDPSQGPGRG